MGFLKAERLSIAPMMGVTDRHCRYFLRLISRECALYTPMVTANAILHADRAGRARLLDFDPAEKPLFLQLGGANPGALGEAVRIASEWPYDGINLNIGCPSDRVKDGSFGAVLMLNAARAARCMRAMIAANAASRGIALSVKCRIGVDEQRPERDLPPFLAAMRDAGCEHVIIHARKAWLSGLDPRENRTIPPLDYPLVHAMKRRFPSLSITLNGGVGALGEVRAHLAQGVDGVMIGRKAASDPLGLLAEADREIFAVSHPPVPREAIVLAMEDYAQRQKRQGVPLSLIAAPMLGLCHNMPGAKLWRRRLSEESRGAGAKPALFRAIWKEVCAARDAA